MSLSVRAKRQPVHRWLPWLLVLLLLLRAAMPFAAAEGARQRGVAVGELCSVYGVRSVPDDEREGAPPGLDGGDHCALASVLGAALPPVVAALALPQAVTGGDVVPAPTRVAHEDRALAWLAARLHAPPSKG